MTSLQAFNETERIADAAFEYVAAAVEQESDRFGPGWQERLNRRELAEAALRGACGFVNDCAVVGADERLPLETQ